MYNETRFKMVTKMDPKAAKEYLQRAQKQVNNSWKVYQNMANMDYSNDNN
jgi:pyruvate-ferredoxin/flavodoxin oxidoreductase